MTEEEKIKHLARKIGLARRDESSRLFTQVKKAEAAFEIAKSEYEAAKEREKKADKIFIAYFKNNAEKLEDDFYDLLNM